MKFCRTLSKLFTVVKNGYHGRILTQPRTFSSMLVFCSKAPVQVCGQFWQAPKRTKTTKASGMKVTLLGANGCTGQPLALLLKQSPALDEIALYDCNSTCGFGLELSHIDTRCKVTAYVGPDMICEALKGSQVVVILARNRMDTFECNAPVITELILRICCDCPTAFIILATEPVESLLPLIAEVMRLRACYNPHKLLGCVELNCVRANTTLADFLRVPPESVYVPVIGGCTPKTMLPVLSAAVNPAHMTQEQIECITSCIMSGTEAVCAVKGSQCCTPNLAGAYAIARTTLNVVKGLQGRKDVKQCAYCDTLGFCAPDCQFFSSEVTYGPSGIEKIEMPELTKFENCLLYNCLPCIQNEICRAIWLVYSMCNKPVAPCPCVRDPNMPCDPPANWSCDASRDEYLASICREMICKTCTEQLTWIPRPREFYSERASNLTHQLPTRIPTCEAPKPPRSVLLTQELIKKARDPQVAARRCYK